MRSTWSLSYFIFAIDFFFKWDHLEAFRTLYLPLCALSLSQYYRVWQLSTGIASRKEVWISERINKQVYMPLWGNLFEDVPLLEFMYFVFTRMPGESYRRRLGLCCCTWYIFRAMINSLVWWFSERIIISCSLDRWMHTVWIHPPKKNKKTNNKKNFLWFMETVLWHRSLMKHSNCSHRCPS